jgi:hypothetical protein
MVMLPVAVKVPVVGLYNSALLRALESASNPPVTNTMPLFSNVAVWNKRVEVILPVAEKVPVAGLYSSALDKGVP